MSIYFDPNYNIHADALVTGYTAGIKFSPDGTISCKDVVTGYTGIKFSPDYTIYCNDMVLPRIILDKFQMRTYSKALTFV